MHSDWKGPFRRRSGYELTGPKDMDFGEVDSIERTFTRPGFYILNGLVTIKADSLNGIRIMLVNVTCGSKIPVFAAPSPSKMADSITLAWNAQLVVQGNDETWRVSVMKNDTELELNEGLFQYIRAT